MLLLAQGPASIITSVAVSGFAIIVMAFTKKPGLMIIATDAIPAPVSSIKSSKPRIPDQPDLVSVDLEPVSRISRTY